MLLNLLRKRIKQIELSSVSPFTVSFSLPTVSILNNPYTDVSSNYTALEAYSIKPILSLTFTFY